MRVVRFVFVSFVTMIFVCYVYHKSILAYVVQQYHYASDMLILQIPFFSFGDTLANRLESMRIALFESNEVDFLLPQYSHANTIKIQDRQTLDSINCHSKCSKDSILESNSKTNADISSFSKDSANQNDLDSISKQDIKNDWQHFSQADSISNNNLTEKGINTNSSKLALQPQTRFLLIGDSLMQGIGMVLPRMLQQNGFLAKNIAKQSTGLTYPSFFNWEQATRQAFKQYNDIGVLVVCLGANDPWSMPKVRFGTDTWEQIYRSRIQAIFNIAKENNAIVIWYAVPATKNEKLNKKLLYLNSLYKEVAYENGGIFLSSEAILQDGEFSAYLKDSSGKSRLVRAPDGIHFTTYGAKLLAQMLIDLIELPNQSKEISKENIK